MGKTESRRFSKTVIRDLLDNFLESMVRLRVQSVEEPKGSGPNRPDFVAIIRDLSKNGESWRLLIETKSRGEPFFLARAADQLLSSSPSRRSLRQGGQKPTRVANIVVAPNISEMGALVLRERNANYLDLAGNGRLAFGDFFVERTGRRGTPRIEKRASRLFGGKSQVILRAVLSEPKRTWTISSLSKQTGLSIGYTHAIVRKLRDETFVSLDGPGGIAVTRPGELLEAWAKARRLENDLTSRYFSFERSFPKLERRIDEVASGRSMPYALTMTAGAALLAPFTRFSEVQFYVREQDAPNWVEALDVRPTDTGANVVLRMVRDDTIFYGRKQIDGVYVVCEPQLYVDLYNFPARGREQADALRERILRF